MLIQKRAVRALISGALLFSAVCAYSQTPLVTYTDIHDFGAKVNGPLGPQQYDGSTPTGRVTFDSSGNMYGTTSVGAYVNAGAVWELTSAGAYKVLHNFGGTVVNANGKSGHDGYGSQSAVTVDSSGNLYGTTYSGGGAGTGMVWEITAAGVYKDLHDFQATTITQTMGKTGPDGANPVAGVTIDSSGNLFGTTVGGGETFNPNSGMIWEITKAGVYKDIHDFGYSITYSYGQESGLQGGDGRNPTGDITFDSAGNMWGTATGYGYWEEGILWEITAAGTYVDAYDFGNSHHGELIVDGFNPGGKVAIDNSGNIYGTAQVGQVGFGIVWQLTTAGKLNVIHNFDPTNPNAIITSTGQPGPDGENPDPDVVLDPAGNLYGGAYDNTFTQYKSGGLIWEITPAGAYIDLHDFGGSVPHVGGGTESDGQLPLGGVALDRYGNVYGTTTAGGATYKGPQTPSNSDVGVTGSGMIWAIGSLHLLSFPSSTIGAGVKATGTVLLGHRAPIGGTIVNLSGSNAVSSIPSFVTIPAGDYSNTFTIDSARISTTQTATITATQMYASLSQTLTINPITISGFSYFNGPTGGTTATINVDLTGPAPAQGLTVTLSSNSALATVPATVVVPAGATSASFTVTYGTVTTATPVVITGTVGLVNATANITIKP